MGERGFFAAGCLTGPWCQRGFCAASYKNKERKRRKKRAEVQQGPENATNPVQIKACVVGLRSQAEKGAGTWRDRHLESQARREAGLSWVTQKFVTPTHRAVRWILLCWAKSSRKADVPPLLTVRPHHHRPGASALGVGFGLPAPRGAPCRCERHKTHQSSARDL